MHPVIPALRLLIVSEEWFVRSYWESLAVASRALERIVTADDGYTGLAEIWESVAQNAPLTVVVIDRHSVGPSAGRLIAELRADPVTQRTFVAVVAADRAEPREGVNLLCIGEPGQPEMTRMIEEVVKHASAGAGLAAPAPTTRRSGG